MLQLKDICVVDWGNTSLTKKAYEVDGEYLAVSATGADGKISHYEHEADVCVLSAIGAQCGKMFFPQQKFTAIKNTITLTPNKELVDSKYLYYLFTHIELPKRGAAQPFISKGDIEKFELPHLPPLQEQQRIVAKLDAAFAEIDRAIELANAKAAEVELLNSSLLHSTLSGGDWETVKLGEVLRTGAGGTPLKSNKHYYEGGKIRWLLSGAVCEKDIRDSKTHITEEGLTNSSAKIFPKNTVLVAMYGATAGQVGILRTEAATNQAVCGIYPRDDYLPEFLYYYLTKFKETLLLEVSGVAQPNLSQVKIKNIPLPMISLAAQKTVVEKLDAALEQTAFALRSNYEKLANLHTLKSAILAQELQPPQSEAA